MPRREQGPAAVESGNPPSGSVSAPTHTQVLGFEIILLRLKLVERYKTYRRKVISCDGYIAVRSREGHDGT